MKFQDSSFNGLKVTVGTKSVTHTRTLQKQYAHQLFQSWEHNNMHKDSRLLNVAMKRFHRQGDSIFTIDLFLTTISL